MSDLLSNCCAADFDAFGYEKEEGIWQERCLNCGKLCEPIMLSYKDIANIHRCVKWNLAPIDDKPEGEYLFISRKGMAKLGVEPQGNGLISEKLGIKTKPECDHSVELENATGIPSCEVMYKCPKCQEYVTGKLKPEKIEMPEVNITKYGIVHSKEMKNWMQQITEAVNSLKEKE